MEVPNDPLVLVLLGDEDDDAFSLLARKGA